MASGEAIGEILFGALLLIAGLLSFIVAEIPVYCFGALIFGPILLLHGLYKAASDSSGTSHLPPSYGYQRTSDRQYPRQQYPPPYPGPNEYPQYPSQHYPAGYPAAGMYPQYPPPNRESAQYASQKTCDKCGEPVITDALFCINCGEALR